MKQYSSILLLAIAAAALTGCSAMNKNNSRPDSMPSPSGQIRNQADPAKNKLTADMLNGEWTIVKVSDRAVPQEDRMPYITFDAAAGRFYANNGCNTINGSFKLEAGGKLKFSLVAATLMYCPDVAFEHEISALLGEESVPVVTLRNIGHESYITIADKASGLSLEARRHNMEFLNGQWRIAQLNGKTVNDEEANIFIDLNELKVHGNTGCNYFNGVIYIDPSKSNSVEFGNMALTRMACPKFDQEQAMMLALEETTSAIQGDNGRVMLIKADGTPVIVLEKQAVE